MNVRFGHVVRSTGKFPLDNILDITKLAIPNLMDVPMTLAVAPKLDLQDFAERAASASQLLKALANQNRLMLLCKLLEAGEMNVSTLSQAIGLSQSALSQHLARMREEGLVATRRVGQTIYYRVGNPNLARIIGTLRDIFCNPQN
jgi:ArsR family transcriptional regulator, virulence genes transcriptional regulator